MQRVYELFQIQVSPRRCRLGRRYLLKKTLLEMISTVCCLCCAVELRTRRRTPCSLNTKTQQLEYAEQTNSNLDQSGIVQCIDSRPQWFFQVLTRRELGKAPRFHPLSSGCLRSPTKLSALVLIGPLMQVNIWGTSFSMLIGSWKAQNIQMKAH